MEEKVERNIKIYCEKMGYKTPFDTKPTKRPKTYRKLIEDYGLSQTYLQTIVRRMRERYRKEVTSLTTEE